MSGNIWMYSHDISFEDVEMLKHEFITLEQGAEYYHICLKAFTNLARKAGAVYKIGKMVRVKRIILEAYLRKTRIMEEKRND